MNVYMRYAQFPPYTVYVHSRPQQHTESAHTDVSHSVNPLAAEPQGEGWRAFG